MIQIKINKMKKDSEISGHVIIFKDKDHFLSLKRGPTDPWMPNCWCSVGGHVHVDEEIKNGACREVKEECGLTINPKDLIDTGVVKKGRVHFFTTNKYSGNVYLDGKEHSDYKWCSIKDLDQMETTPGLKEMVFIAKQKVYNAPT
jgi:8-oxo-dGTP pyrophosphatase MutT (NUDIX family)